MNTSMNWPFWPLAFSISVYKQLIPIYASEANYLESLLDGYIVFRKVVQVLEALYSLEENEKNIELLQYFHSVLASSLLANNKLLKADQSIQRIIQLDHAYLQSYENWLQNKDQLTQILKKNELTPELEIEAKIFEASLDNAIARYFLLTGEVDIVDQTLSESLSSEAKNPFAPLFMAPTLLFQGQTESAKNLYSKMKHEPFPGPGFETYKDAFLHDFNLFQEKGLIQTSLKQDVESIKRMLAE